MKKFAICILAALAITLLWGAVAYAATPQDIYNDYADNGKLDGHYTDAELKRTSTTRPSTSTVTKA